MLSNQGEAVQLPRKKHSHRCKLCGQGVYCYKSQCMKPQRIEACANCNWEIRNGRRQEPVGGIYVS